MLAALFSFIHRRSLCIRYIFSLKLDYLLCWIYCQIIWRPFCSFVLNSWQSAWIIVDVASCIYLRVDWKRRSMNINSGSIYVLQAVDLRVQARLALALLDNRFGRFTFVAVPRKIVNYLVHWLVLFLANGNWLNESESKWRARLEIASWHGFNWKSFLQFFKIEKVLFSICLIGLSAN